MENLIIVGVIGILVFVVILLLCREVACWYLKINQRIKNQEDIKELLDQLVRIERQRVRLEAEKTKSGTFNVGDLVVSKEGKQMRVKEIKQDKYACYTNGGVCFEGLFDESELTLFSDK